MIIAMHFSGFFFLFVIILNIASGRFGYETYNGLDSASKLEKISKDIKAFRIGYALILLEHLSIIALAISMFIAFKSYSLILGIIFLASRTMEALIQIYNKRKYWRLLALSERFSSASEGELQEITDSGLDILKSKNVNFSIAQIFFSIGTFSYSLIFALYGAIPIFFGWFGIIASLIYLGGNIVRLMKIDFNAVWNLGGLLIFVFEFLLGGWLLFFSSIF